MDAKRLQEIDQKIKRYEGIDALLHQDLQEEENKDSVNQEKTDDIILQYSGGEENEQG
jgi:hypothetical protein